jgi:Helix-hairpin-helix domain
MSLAMDNLTAAEKLERVAALLEAQHANPYRVDGWKAAAARVRSAAEPLAPVAEKEGVEGLVRAVGLGQGTASALAELLASGHLRLLDRLEGATAPEDLFLRVPGLGPTLAANAHTQLGIETLEELEAAAADGRLSHVPGFGPRRVSLVQSAVAAMLENSMRRGWRRAAAGDPAFPAPSVDTLIAVDAAYRRGVELGALPMIAPTRFNPEHVRWLPVLHSESDGYHFTAMYSNTARAHRLGRTHDWVVLYFERDGHEGQCTVVTETHGPHSGERVVRGRELERRAA